MRICCLSNSKLEKLIDMAERGLAPGQHGWGVQQLSEVSSEVLIAPYSSASDRRVLDRLSTKSRHLFGQLDQELWALHTGADVLYSADQWSLAGIAVSRKMLARRARLVSVAHHPLRGRRARMQLASMRAHDAVLSISKQVANELNRVGVRSQFVPWGPDLASGLYAASRDEGFAISTGKSNRDIRVLVSALAKTGFPGTVFDLDQIINGQPRNVTMIHPGGANTDLEAGRGYVMNSVLDLTREAGFVAIPIAEPDRLTGLAEINDALALGKPIVITQSPYTPIDVEHVGCGIAVEPGDVDGWVDAINTLRDPRARSEMGARGRRFAEEHWNYAIFGAALVDLVTGRSA